MSRCPLTDPDSIYEQVENQSRGPFRAFLARVLSAAPTLEAIHALAQKNPDRYGQLMAIAARTAGYTEKLEVEGTVTQRIQALSDAELLSALERERFGLDTPSTPKPTHPPVKPGDGEEEIP